MIHPDLFNKQVDLMVGRNELMVGDLEVKVSHGGHRVYGVCLLLFVLHELREIKIFFFKTY